MSDFKKWFAARARNPDKITLEEAFDAGASAQQRVQPAPSVPMDVIADYLVSISAHLARRDDAKAQAEIGELLKMIAPAPKPAPSVPDTYAAGINAVAAMLQSKAAEYAKEHGHDDMGGLSFGSGIGGEIKMDYYTTLIELADDVRAMLAGAPEAKP